MNNSNSVPPTLSPGQIVIYGGYKGFFEYLGPNPNHYANNHLGRVVMGDIRQVFTSNGQRRRGAVKTVYLAGLRLAKKTIEDELVKTQKKLDNLNNVLKLC